MGRQGSRWGGGIPHSHGSTCEEPGANRHRNVVRLTLSIGGPVSEFAFLKSDDGAESYEVYRQGDLIGLVWEREGIWFADPFRMPPLAHQASNRDDAALHLVRLNKQG